VGWISFLIMNRQRHLYIPHKAVFSCFDNLKFSIFQMVVQNTTASLKWKLKRKFSSAVSLLNIKSLTLQSVDSSSTAAKNSNSFPRVLDFGRNIDMINEAFAFRSIPLFIIFKPRNFTQNQFHKTSKLPQLEAWNTGY
jgi:hypothetical protein